MMRHRLARWLIAALLAGAMLGAVTPDARADLHPPLFGTRELASGDIGFFPQWTAALDRQVHQQSVRLAALDGLGGVTTWDQVQAVNDAVNRVSYAEDIDNWGVPDHWSTPAEFFARGGDCEDYAIAKYMALRELGVAADRLRIVVVQDERNYRRHAVLAVYTGDDILILDNQMAVSLPASQIGHYRPYYSINELGWWLH